MKTKALREKISEIRLEILTAICMIVSEFEKKELAVELFKDGVVFREGQHLQDRDMMITGIEEMGDNKSGILGVIIEHDGNTLNTIPLKDLDNDKLLNVLDGIELAMIEINLAEA